MASAPIGPICPPMTEKTLLDAALQPVAGARATARIEGARASIILDVTGLDEAARDQLEQAVHSAARGRAGDRLDPDRAHERTHAAHADRGGERQGRGGQVDGLGQSRDRPEGARPARRPCRRRYLWPVPAQADGRRGIAADRKGKAAPAGGDAVRRAPALDGPARRGRSGDRLARTDGGRRARPTGRRGLGRCRIRW